MWEASPSLYPNVINPFTPKSDQCPISLQPHQKYYITQYGELGFPQLTQMKDDFTTNSHSLAHAFLFRKVGRMYFLNLGVKGLSDACEVRQDSHPVKSHGTSLIKAQMQTGSQYSALLHWILCKERRGNWFWILLSHFPRSRFPTSILVASFSKKMSKFTLLEAEKYRDARQIQRLCLLQSATLMGCYKVRHCDWCYYRSCSADTTHVFKTPHIFGLFSLDILCYRGWFCYV